MNKKLKHILTGAACLSMALVFTAGCTPQEDPNPGPGPDKVYKTDPETVPVTLSIGQPDTKFNPFFYTAQNDGNIVALTQISMLSTDSNADIVCGENEATVALDYYTERNAAADTTTYRFLIKNGIKYSDGTPLTIKDVLFNMYVYLDPQYNGSTTMYSVDIQGLKAYRAQDPDLGDSDSDEEFNNSFNSRARDRIDAMIAYDDEPSANQLTDQIKKDIYKVSTRFREELLTDWNNNLGSLKGYEEEYGFTEDWQSYFLTAGLIGIEIEEVKENGVVVGKQIKRNNAGKYYTALDDPNDDKTEYMTAATTADKIASYMQAHNCDETLAKSNLMRDAATDYVYSEYFNTENKIAHPDDSKVMIEMPVSAGNKLTQILQRWQTGSTVLSDIASELKTEYYNGLGGQKVKSISGITTYNTKTFNGKSYDDTHDVLQIVINGVDPVAIYNFGFTVAPMHYYSGSYGGTDYLKIAQDTVINGDYNDPNKGADYRFGVKAGDINFLNDVVGNSDKTLLPVGAGAYKVSDQNGGAGSATTFWDGTTAYYQRNDQFYTVGSGLHNAKIKYLRYRVVTDDMMMTALEGKQVDYGTPNCTPDNVSKVKEMNDFYNASYPTNGYGYVGINAKFVPDKVIRQAIMMAMDEAAVVRYYRGECTPIYKPVSTKSWVYVRGNGSTWSRHSSIPIDSNGDVIRDMIIKSNIGWEWTGSQNNGLFMKDGKTLKFTFTIAGGSQDHPAYDMFTEAAEILNANGFDITVTADISALSKLANGELAVWAAAWSSGVDPDLYQVWHIDSNASSVKNWGYDAIKADPIKYSYEYNKIKELSDIIELARSTDNKDERTDYYLDAYDKIMDLAVEMPLYQRNDLVAFNRVKIDETSVNTNPSAYADVLDRIWELDYN